MSGWAWLVEHETGESAIKLPAEGGSVWVDVVLAAEGPVQAFAGRRGADAAKTVSVDAADWTVATLRLDIAPGSGTVRLLLSDAYAVDATGALILLAPGPDLEIVIEQE